MKGSRVALLILTASLSMVLGVFCCWRACDAIFAMDSYQLSIDPLVSSSSKKILKKIVAQNYNKSCNTLSEQLLKACPAIKNIAIIRCADQKLKIAIDIHAPYMRIAEQGVLLENGNLVHAYHFTNNAIKKVPQVQLAKHTDSFSLSKEFVTWLQQLDSHVLNNFFITWHDDYQIYLQNKNTPTQTILAGITTPVNGEIIQVCMHIVDQKINLEQGTARVSWCADIRFDKQIIISSHKGGAWYG